MTLDQCPKPLPLDNTTNPIPNEPRKVFQIVSVGWGLDLIERILDNVEKSVDLEFVHILGPEHDLESISKLSEKKTGKYHCLRENRSKKLPQSDEKFLRSLEAQEVPTIHNMIMSDRVLCHINYADALSYLTYIARRLLFLFNALKPSIVLGSFDNCHSSIALAVAQKLSIPFVAMNFSVIPPGYCCFCTSMSPNSRINLGLISNEESRRISEKTLTMFMERSLSPPPVYVSNRSLCDVARKIPMHLSLAISRINTLIFRGHDKYSEYSILRLFNQYMQKRLNLLRLPTQILLTTPPDTPYLFIGLHMQPESSIDVWAHFFSNQFNVIEAIARSTPPTHRLLVKIHKSDSDSYSPTQLRQLQALPGVLLVSPFVDSRPFIENANVVLAIQGTIGLEAALLGLPVIMFGDSPVLNFPSASRVGAIVDLPELIRKKLSEKRRTSEQIIDSFQLYLRPYCLASANDWTRDISISALTGYAQLFDGLKTHVQKREWLHSHA